MKSGIFVLQNMRMVEPGHWDVFVEGVPGGEDDFSNLLNILDFPMESLEGDEELAGDWDASKSQSLGPIPLDALMGVPHGKVCDGGLDTPSKPIVPVSFQSSVQCCGSVLVVIRISCNACIDWDIFVGHICLQIGDF